MKLKKLLITSLLSTAFLASGFAMAEEEKSNAGPYVQLNGGISMGMAPKSDFGNKKMGNSAVYGAELGYQFEQYLRISLSLDDRAKYSFTENQNYNTSTVSTRWKVKSLVTMVNFYYDIMEFNKVTPYMMFGAGIAKNKASGTQTSNGESSGIPSGTKNNFAYKLGLGAKYKITNNVAVNLQYQYIDMGKIKTGTNAAFTESNNGKIRANEFLFGIAYKF